MYTSALRALRCRILIPRCPTPCLALHSQNQPRPRSSLEQTRRKRAFSGSRLCSTSASTSTSMGSIQSSLAQDANHVRKQVVHHAAIALGSNMGDKVGFIEQSLHLMAQRGIRVISVSPLYATKAMYYENQDSFVNGTCYIETTLEPLELLDELQDIENKLGRVRTIDKGPRTLDLDVILYDDQHILHERLQVPHKLLLEREFVLRPLADILPHYTFPVSFVMAQKADPQSVVASLQKIQDSSSPMYSMTALSPRLPFITPADVSRKTQIMSVLNITPDSFSDGGVHSEHDLEKIKSAVRAHILAGATILDVGGQSTRPNAEMLSASEELSRVLPVIKTIRSMPEAEGIAISVDTFHSQVARETISHGADIVNDVSGGLLDPEMLADVAALDKTIVLMHMRGNPQTMNKLTDYPDGVVRGVAVELAERVKAAKAAGIRPWRVVLDPGIGFAKTQEQNLDLIRGLATLRNDPEFAGMPWLVGVSRKGFIGKITGVQSARERVWGTGAAVTASIAGGADIVRVHDVAEMGQLAKMADAIYRRP